MSEENLAPTGPITPEIGTEKPKTWEDYKQELQDQLGSDWQVSARLDDNGLGYSIGIYNSFNEPMGIESVKHLSPQSQEAYTKLLGSLESQVLERTQFVPGDFKRLETTPGDGAKEFEPRYLTRSEKKFVDRLRERFKAGQETETTLETKQNKVKETISSFTKWADRLAQKAKGKWDKFLNRTKEISKGLTPDKVEAAGSDTGRIMEKIEQAFDIKSKKRVLEEVDHEIDETLIMLTELEDSQLKSDNPERYKRLKQKYQERYRSYAQKRAGAKYDAIQATQDYRSEEAA